MYGVGIVGLGWVAGGHLQSFLRSKHFRPTAIMSTRKLDSKELHDAYGIDAKVYNDYEAFLRDPDVQVVDICTPHFLHPQQTILASEAGKAIIVEKPIALNYPDAKRMLDAVERNNTRTSVCFELRFSTLALAIKSIVDQGLVGEVYYAESDYYHGIGPWYANQRWEVKRENGGSSLLRAGCHALDILLYLVGGEVDEVMAYGNKSGNEVYEPYDYDLNTVMLLKFKDGKIGKVTSSTDCTQPYVFNINLLGSLGSVKNDRFYSKKIEGTKGWSKLDVELIDSGEVTHHPYTAQFDHFGDCLEKGIDPHNNLASALYSHKVVFAVDRSAEEGRPVKISELD
ncbi:MAG TPA: Gfo/Idh/MocA family oxidoreductase [Spirochaetia bacterium]|nr:Gfo/Idh/MocA family oxidoreductase [Spirochaetia bacterium]